MVLNCLRICAGCSCPLLQTVSCFQRRSFYTPVLYLDMSPLPCICGVYPSSCMLPLLRKKLQVDTPASRPSVQNYVQKENALGQIRIFIHHCRRTSEKGREENINSHGISQNNIGSREQELLEDRRPRKLRIEQDAAIIRVSKQTSIY